MLEESVLDTHHLEYHTSSGVKVGNTCVRTPTPSSSVLPAFLMLALDNTRTSGCKHRSVSVSI